MFRRIWLAMMMALLHGLTAAYAFAQAPATPMLELRIGSTVQSFSQRTLLARADIATIRVDKDIAYRTAMTFRGVPLADLLGNVTLPADQVLEARATDGFAAQLPMDLVRNRDTATAVAWLVIEDPAHRWPNLPGKSVSAGPFYLVWIGRQAASVRSEQWPYQIAQFATQPSPASRWPALAVDPRLPATDPIRTGQSLFITQCLACHRLNHAGNASIGPDLNVPMNPVEYFQAAALRRYIRNPASVRDWRGRTMPAFSPEQLSDREIGLVIDYLAYMAKHKVQQ